VRPRPPEHEAQQQQCAYEDDLDDEGEHGRDDSDDEDFEDIEPCG
jgi:hypothetical protein